MSAADAVARDDAQVVEIVARALGSRIHRFEFGKSDLTGVLIRDAETVLTALRTAGLTVGAERWLPIESAPRDGTVIDLWVKGRSSEGWRVANAQWVYGDWQIKISDGFSHCFDKAAEDSDAITHWRPLPAAPSEGGSDG